MHPQGLLIFDTHPIQYRSPLFKSICEKNEAAHIYFFNKEFDSKKWWFNEKGQIPEQIWKKDFTKDFPNTLLETKKTGCLRSFLKINALLKSKPKAVLLFGYYQWEHWVVWLLCRFHNIPILFVAETFLNRASFFRRLFKFPLLKFFYSGVDHFIAIGRKSVRYYEENGISKTRITQAKYCTDPSFFYLPKEHSINKRLRWRERNGIPPHAIVLLFVGRLVPRKRPADMILLHELLCFNSKIYTCIVGNGMLEKELHKQADGLSHLFFLGFQTQEETRDCYFGSDLLVVPSEYESWGLVINEAFAAGIPALVTENCGAAGDLVIPEETGFIMPVGDIRFGSKLIDKCLGKPGVLQNMGKAAQEKVLKEFHVEQFADAILTGMVTQTAG